VGEHILTAFKTQLFEGIVEAFDAKHRDRKNKKPAGPCWRVRFPEDDTVYWLPWVAGPQSPCVRDGLAAAKNWGAQFGVAPADAPLDAVARQLPRDGGPQLQTLLAVLGRWRIRRAAGDGDCAFHSVGFARGQPNAGASGVYKARDAAQLRSTTHAWLRDHAPASWAAQYGSDWATILTSAERAGAWVGAAALRALAITAGRDLVLFNGLPRSKDCRVTYVLSLSKDCRVTCCLYKICSTCPRRYQYTLRR